MTASLPTVLVFGYGNPGRLDDGLGPALVEAVGKWNLPGVECDAAYQLSIEDAEAMARYDCTIFVDATVDGTDTFSFKPLKPQMEWAYTTHHLEPPCVLGLARSLFNDSVRGYVLAVRGYAFNDFGEVLSRGARENLEAALTFLQPLLEKDRDRLVRDEPILNPSAS